MATPQTLERTRCAELLALADASAVIDLAEQLAIDTEPPVVVRGPETGSVVMTVREPVESTRFQLGDVLVTQVEVEHRSTRGWAMRMGSDQLATLAAAVCDAEIAAEGPLAAQVRELCATTAASIATARHREWAELEPTIVTFEAMEA